MSGIKARASQFYGRRRGRPLRPFRARLVNMLLPRLTVPLPPDGPVDLALLFTRSTRELWIEVGFGAGEHLAALARGHPEVGFIGCEPYVNGMAGLLATIEREGLKNIRLWPDDARPLLDRLPDGSVHRLFLLFPDPWPKVRHQQRRFIQTEVVDTLARIVAPGGLVRFASDDGPLVDWTLFHMLRKRQFIWTAQTPECWRNRPKDWPPTRYEAKRLHGSPVFLSFQRVGAPCNPARRSVFNR